MFQIIIYYLHSASELSFHIYVVLALSIYNVNQEIDKYILYDIVLKHLPPARSVDSDTQILTRTLQYRDNGFKMTDTYRLPSQ